MKIFQINQIKTDLLSAFKRFPLFITFCIALTVVSIYTIENERQLEWITKLNLYHFLSILSMGIFFILAVTNYAEKVKLPLKKLFLVQGIFVVFMVLYYFISPDKFSTFELSMRIVSINLGLIFLVIYLPYHKDNDLTAFWQYTKTLFLRLMTTYLFTMILYFGLSLALLAIDSLFGVKIDGDLYLYLFIVLTGFFAPVFFTGGLKKDYSVFSTELVYPKALKFLVLYILLPIVVLYMLILYVYATKIIILWQFPSGWVSNLVLSFSIVGLISFFLTYPLRNSENKFISGFFKLYFWFMLPLIALLFVAIFKRIGVYGITELRYYVMLLAFWLAFISIYLIITKYKDLKIIALSFFIIAVFTSFGPWGAFSVSKKSQLNRFEKILTENNMIKDGLIVKSDSIVDKKTNRNLSSIVSYIVHYHDVKSLQKYFKVDFDTLFKDDYSRYNKETLILEQMGLQYVSQWDLRYDEDTDDYISYVSFGAELNQNIVDISNHDILININNYYYNDPYNKKDTIIKRDYITEKFTINESFNINSNILSYDTENENINILTLDFKPFIKELIKENPSKNSYNVKPEKLHFENHTDFCDVDFQILTISLNNDSNNHFTNLSFTARLMIKVL